MNPTPTAATPSAGVSASDTPTNVTPPAIVAHSTVEARPSAYR
jgi:hypothetical protein